MMLTEPSNVVRCQRLSRMSQRLMTARRFRLIDERHVALRAALGAGPDGRLLQRLSISGPGWLFADGTVLFGDGRSPTGLR